MKKLLKITVMLVVMLLSLVLVFTVESSAIMEQKEIKSRLSTYSSWESCYEDGMYYIECPTRDVSDDRVFSYINDITSRLRGELAEDYCEITVQFPFSEKNYYSFNAFTETAFVLEDKIKSFWTNWSETNQLDVICNYVHSSSGGTVYNKKIELKLNGSDPDNKMSDYDKKLMQIVKEGTSRYSDPMKLVNYYCSWLDTNVKYSLWYQYTNSPYVALMLGKGVCGSYANALKDMCELSGIPAIVPVNQEPLNHAWNEVYIRGKWYTVDLCYVIEPSDGKYNGFCFTNVDRKKFPVDYLGFIEKHKAEYVSTFKKKAVKSISSCTFSMVSDYTYSGKGIKPAVTVKNGNTVLKKDVHYIVSYADNKMPGKATVTIKGISSAGYTGSKVITFKILPAKVTKLKASVKGRHAKLSWSAVPGASGYRIFLYNSKTGKYKVLKDAYKKTEYTVKNLPEGKKSKLAVRAYVTVDKKSVWSKTSTTVYAVTKPAQADVKVSSTENSITLSWNRSSGAKGYKIYLYNAQKKKWKRLATTAKTSYTLKELTTGKKYKLAVRAYAVIDSKELLSAYEPFVCSTRPAAPNVSVGTAKNGKVQVKWSAVKGADGYQIYYSTKKNEGYKKLTDQVKASYTVNAKSKKTYYIKVRAYVKVDDVKVYGSFSGVRKI